MTSATCGTRSDVKAWLTPSRRARVVENDQYAAFVQRVIAAYSRRVAGGDINAITGMTGIAAACAARAPGYQIEAHPAAGTATAGPLVTAAAGCANHGRFRDHAGVWHRYLPAIAPPPRDICVQRGTDHPRHWRRVAADGAP